MAATQHIQAQLSDLQRKYAEHKQSFEKWKIDNSMQVGSESYTKYVEDFLQWEREALDCIEKLNAQLQASAPVSGPENIDAVLHQLLEDVSQSEFVAAIEEVSAKDRTFLQCLVNNYRQLINGTLEPGIVMVGGVPMKSTSYHSMGYGIGQTTSPVTRVPVASWQPVPKSFRPPSPVREYKSSGLPFKDFSQ